MTTVSDTSGQLPRGKITCQMERNPGRCVLGVWRRGAKRVPRISSSIVATDWATPDFGWANKPWRWRRLALMAWLRRCLGKNWDGSPRKRDARTYLPKKKRGKGWVGSAPSVDCRGVARTTRTGGRTKMRALVCLVATRSFRLFGILCCQLAQRRSVGSGEMDLH